MGVRIITSVFPSVTRKVFPYTFPINFAEVSPTLPVRAGKVVLRTQPDTHLPYIIPWGREFSAAFG